MALKDRLLEATYISHSGTPFNFLYEDVSMSSEKKTTGFTFPDYDGAYIQDLGVGERKFPLKVIFSGENSDLQADNFFKALEEKGNGTLIHPIYGTKTVVPVGEIKREDNLTSSENETIIDVVFAETIALNKTLKTSAFGNILNSVNNAKASLDKVIKYTSFNFVKTFFVSTAGELISIKDASLQIVTDVSKQISYVIGGNNGASALMKDKLLETINDIGNKPINFINGIIEALFIPARIPNYDIENKMDTYQKLIDNRIKRDVEISLIKTNENNNAFALDKAYTYFALAAMCESAINESFKSRDKTININERIEEYFQKIKKWTDERSLELKFIDDGSDYDALIKLVSCINNYLVVTAFNLPSLMKIKLDGERNILELMAELYGSLDDIDDFIELNKLNLDEIEILPSKKEIVYYG